MKLISNVENAERVKITDTSGNFAATNVEDALQEVSESLQDRLTVVTTDASLTGNGTAASPLSAAAFAIAMSIALG